MIDPDALLRQDLLTYPTIEDTFDERIFAQSKLPKGWQPTDGPTLLYSIRGGNDDYTGALLFPSYQFRIYAATERQAKEAAYKLMEVLRFIRSAHVNGAYLEALPSPLFDFEIDCPSVITYWTVQFRN